MHPPVRPPALKFPPADVWGPGMRGNTTPRLGPGSTPQTLVDVRLVSAEPAPLTLAWTVSDPAALTYWEGRITLYASGGPAGSMTRILDAGQGGQATVVACYLSAKVEAIHAAGLDADSRSVSGWVSLGTRPAGSEVVRSFREAYGTKIPRPAGCDAVRVIRPASATTGVRLYLRQGDVADVATVDAPAGYEMGWVPIPAAADHILVEKTAGAGSPPTLLCRLDV